MVYSVEIHTVEAGITIATHDTKELTAVSGAPATVDMDNRNLSIISANVRGFRTNIGDFTNKFVIPRRPDVVIAVETFLNDTVPEGYGKIKGYTNWQRKDRINGSFGGVAVCFKNSIQFVYPLIFP